MTTEQILGAIAIIGLIYVIALVWAVKSSDKDH